MIDFTIPKFTSHLDTNNLSLQEICEGNLNFIYKLSDSRNTYVLKHAKHYLKMLGSDFKLTQKRIIAEMNSMEYFHSLTPNFIPKIYYKNDKEYFFIMEYLDGYQNLRESASNIQAYLKLGDFLCSLALNKPKKNLYYECEELKQITKNYVFEFPFIKNHESLVIKDYAHQAQFSKTFLSNKERLKDVFLHSKSSLIHGDFHTDSIMVKDKNIAIIDSEFSLFCEVSFDIGNLLAHILFNSIALKNTLYKEKILTLFKPLEKLDNFNAIFKNSVGFCAIEMARRLYVPAKSKDLENATYKEEAYKLTYTIANDLGSNEITDVDSLLIKLEQYL